MITYQNKGESLTISYNNQIIIHHTKKDPAFYLGSGNEFIDSYRGNYQINDLVQEKIGLIEFLLNENTITFFSDGHELILNFKEENNRLYLSFEASNNYNRFWMRVNAEKDELIYGCGEQPSFFNLRNRIFPLWTSESGVGRDKQSQTTKDADMHDKAGGDYYTTYYPEPTFISTRKYWLHVDSYAYSEFNFINSNYHELYFWEVPKQAIISFKKSYLELLTDLTEYTGRPPMLPSFLLDGIILGVQGGIERVSNILDQTLESEVNVRGLWCQDWAGIKYTTFGKRLYWNWILNNDLYPNLVQKIKELEQKNIAFMTYICPFLLENESLFNEAKKHDYLAFNQNGEVYTVDFGEFYCGIVDLTNPKAFTWYKEIIKTNIIHIGIKGWMADFGEYLPTDCVLFNKVDAKLMHNKWPILWAKCNYEALVESNKIGEAFFFMRSGNHKSQKYATSLWAGDQSVNWDLHDGIASVIPSALSSGMTGVPFTHSDIGGYTSLYGNIRTKELFDRWLEMNVFTTFMRTHEGNRPNQNFQFYQDQDTLNLMARMTKIRADLKPYIIHLFKEGSEKGLPVQRPIFLHYEEDLIAYHLQYEYLFGADVLVKPVIQKAITEQEVYLPNDEWIHLWSGNGYSGNKTVKVSCPIGQPPVFYRSKSKFKDIFAGITKKYK